MTTEPSYPLLTQREETLMRQVHPDQVQANGVPDSSAFMAKQPHNYLLSTRREHIGAQQAYEDWIVDHESVGTYGILVADIMDESLTAFDDSTDPNMPDGHASVDFRGVSDGQARKRARRLRDKAVGRGRLYPADDACIEPEDPPVARADGAQ
jgi:hypothetical protein